MPPDFWLVVIVYSAAFFGIPLAFLGLLFVAYLMSKIPRREG